MTTAYSVTSGVGVGVGVGVVEGVVVAGDSVT
jgi:hypothetical protein